MHYRIDEEKKNIKISIKELLEDPFKNIRKDFTEKGDHYPDQAYEGEEKVGTAVERSVAG